MKKPLFLFLLGASIAAADTSEYLDPVYHLTFDEIAGSDNKNIHNPKFLENTGSAAENAFSANSTAYLNYTTGSANDYLGNASGHSYQNKGNSFITITPESSSGIHLGHDFTLTLAIRLDANIITGSNEWRNILNLTSGSQSTYLQTSSTNSLMQGLHGNGISNTGLTTTAQALSSSEFTRLTLVYDASERAISLYQDASLLNTYTSTLGTGTLTFEIGGKDKALMTPLFIDEVAIYNIALSDRQVSSLVGRESGAVAVPEPATATLSLLALAGLCTRRRRK